VFCLAPRVELKEEWYQFKYSFCNEVGTEQNCCNPVLFVYLSILLLFADLV